MKTILKRALCLALVLLFAMSALVACKKSTNTPAESQTEGSQISDVVESDSETETKLNDEITLGTYDFEGAEYKILTRKTTRYEFDSENDKGLDAVNNAIFLRNETVKSTFNVSLRFEETNGGWNSDFVEVYGRYMTGWSDVSLMAAHFPMQQLAAMQGYCRDMTTLKTEDGAFDMTKEWWSKQFYENCNIEGKFYVAVGDIGYTLYEYLQVVFFNEQLAETYVVDAAGNPIDLYDLVREDEWTYDNFKTFIKNVNYVEADPIYGLTTNAHSIRSFATCFEVQYMEKDESGAYTKYSFPQTASLSTCTIIDDIVEFIRRGTANGVEYNKNSYDPREKECNALFTKGDALFYTQMLGEVVTIAKDMDENSSFGILPFPKYNEDQLEYHTAIRDSVTAISIPKTVQDLVMAGVITEALCAYSYQNVRPAYLNTVIGDRYMTNDDLKEMMDLVRSTFTVDFVMAFGSCLGTPFSAPTNLLGASNEQKYSSFYEGKQATFAANLAELYKAFGVSA